MSISHLVMTSFLSLFEKDSTQRAMAWTSEHGLELRGWAPWVISELLNFPLLYNLNPVYDKDARRARAVFLCNEILCRFT